MKEQKRRQSLSGAVLIMVLTVMVVLIIMLMATLTVVTTANRRIYTKYEENQAYYTARSALDIFKNSMIYDKTYYAYDDAGHIKIYKYGNNQNANMKQGLGLQLDLYALTVYEDDGHGHMIPGTSAGYENIDQNALTARANSLSGDDKKDEYIDYFGTKPGGTDIPYVEYLVTLPAISDGSSNYGMFSDGAVPMGGAAAATGGTAKIKVEVVGRTYDLGTCGGAPVNDRAAFYASATDAQIAEAIMNGDRVNDKMRVKITATASFLGNEASAVLYCDTSQPPFTNTSRAVTAFGGTNLKNMNILGGVSGIDPVNWDNIGATYGGVYVEGEWYNMSQGGKYRLTENECFFVGSNLSWQSQFQPQVYDVTSGTDRDKRPFVFVGGTYGKKLDGTGSSNATMGTDTADGKQKLDLLCCGIEGISNDFKNYGDVYCKGDVDFTTNTNIDIKGDFYIDGNLTVNTGNGSFQFETPYSGAPILYIPADTNLYMKAGSQINGYDVSGVTIMKTGATSPVTVPTFTADIGFASTYADTDGDGTYEYSDTALKAKDTDNSTPEVVDVTLPNGVKKKIPSHEQMYNEYYQVDSSGNLILDASNNPIPITAEQKAFTSSADLAAGNYSTKQFTEADIGTTGTLSLANNNAGMKLDGTANPDGWDINTNGGTVRYVLSSGGHSTAKYGNQEGGYKLADPGHDLTEAEFSSAGMYIYGGGTAELLLQPGTYWGNIIVADDTQLIVYAPGKVGASPAVYNLEKFSIFNETIYNAYVRNLPIDTGNSGANLIKPPINYYFGDGAVVKGENDFFMAGYFYGPGAEFNAIKQGIELKCNYNGITAKSHDDNEKIRLSFVGSILCKNIIYDNALGGVAYINPSASTGQAGEPIHKMDSYRYARY